MNRAGPAEMVDVKEIFGKSLNKLNGSLAQSGVAVLDRIPAGLPRLMVERDKFERLVELLLKEEIVSLSSGKQIVFSARHRSGADEVVEIEITDNGPGLSRDALRAVFDPFARMEKHHDFGINLLACYFIVYHHGGKIDVRSEEGQGATFTLTFPIQPKSNSPAEEEQAFLQRVLANDAFWERVIADDE
jgi:signal transduction histidine kinase